MPRHVLEALALLTGLVVLWRVTHLAPPAEKNAIVWHLFEDKYTGLANKDAGDFDGEWTFILSTFQPFEKANPEASIQNNIFEMSEVNVTGWSTDYQACNAPGNSATPAPGVHVFDCPETGDYCCAGKNATQNTLPARKAIRQGLRPAGFWYSFPRESEGVTWTEKVVRRIRGSCLGSVWRADAGGCGDCGEELDSCVAECIQAALSKGRDTTLLRASWDRAFNSADVCPDVPFPESSTLVMAKDGNSTVSRLSAAQTLVIPENSTLVV